MKYFSSSLIAILYLLSLPKISFGADIPIKRSPTGKFPAADFSASIVECASIKNNSERGRILIRSNPLEIFQMNEGGMDAVFHGGKIAKNATCQGKITKTNTSRRLSLSCREKSGKLTTDTSLSIDLAGRNGRLSFIKKGQTNFSYSWTLQECD